MFDLKGKKALITGGSRGIGRAASLLLAEAGCDVAINYIRDDKAAHAVQKKVEALEKECLVLQADVSKKDEVKALVDRLRDQWEKLDILVNNAGIWTFGRIGDMDEETWRKTMQINLDGVFFMCNNIVPWMKMHKNSSIINVSSTAGIRGEAFHSHYAASKGALVSFTKSLAVELAPNGIRVNCVAPGWVETDMCSDVFKDLDYKNKVMETIPLKRIPQPKDIAGPIVFLASEMAMHITGEVLNVNGGSVLCS